MADTFCLVLVASNYGGDERASATNHQLQNGLNKKEITNHGVEPEFNDKYESLLLQKKELEQALTRKTAIVTADQISANQIEF